MRISVEKSHHQSRLRILSCSRMSENHREPEVPEAEVPVVECIDGFARITSQEFATTRSVKSDTLQNCCSTRPRVVADLGRSALMHIARLKSQGDDKSAVAMLKKNDMCENMWQSFVNRDKS